jgi:hypothetical protein
LPERPTSRQGVPSRSPNTPRNAASPSWHRRRRDGVPLGAAAGSPGCARGGRRAPPRSPGGARCCAGGKRAARHPGARACSRPGLGRSTGRRRRCTCTRGTAPPDRSLLRSRAPPLRRRDGFLAFVVGFGDGPRVGHSRRSDPRVQAPTWALFLFVTPRAPTLPGGPPRGPERVGFPRISMAAYTRAQRCGSASSAWCGRAATRAST